MYNIGKQCPYCKMRIDAKDEVVICRECHTPHHKSCWIANGGCTNLYCKEYAGNKKTAPESAAPAPPVPPASPAVAGYCTQCGTPFHQGSKFCKTCGTFVLSDAVPQPAVSSTLPMNSQAAAAHEPKAVSPEPVQQAVPAAPPVYQPQQPIFVPVPPIQHNDTGEPKRTKEEVEFLRLLGDRAYYYRKKFEEMDRMCTATSWNWCSFLFGPYWFAYRKMYIHALLYYLLLNALSFLPVIGYLIPLILVVCSGMFGNYFYKRYINHTIDQLQNISDERERNERIKRSGGVSGPAVFIAVAINLVVCLIRLLV